MKCSLPQRAELLHQLRHVVDASHLVGASSSVLASPSRGCLLSCSWISVPWLHLYPVVAFFPAAASHSHGSDCILIPWLHSYPMGEFLFHGCSRSCSCIPIPWLHPVLQLHPIPWLHPHPIITSCPAIVVSPSLACIPCLDCTPVPWLHPHPIVASCPAVASLCHGCIPIPWLHSYAMSASHPLAAPPCQDCIPMPWLHPIPWLYPCAVAAFPCHACILPCSSIPPLHTSPPFAFAARFAALVCQGLSHLLPLPTPVPNHSPSFLPVRAAEPGLQCHPLQEHFRHVPRRFTSSPHLGHGAHHPPAAGALRHQLFHFTQRGAHPQEKLGEVLHPNLFR